MKISNFIRLACILLFVHFNGNVHAQSKDFLMGRYNYTRDTSFVKVSNKFTNNTVYLKKETYTAFLRMQQAALRSGINLFIISGTRSFNDQQYKWELKWRASEFANITNTKQKAIKLLRWWSMPSTSRHHWGTDIDLNNMKVAYYQTKEGKKLYDWLVKNAPKFGFQQPFNANRATGYQEEKWHWSYVPLAAKYLKAYVKQVSNADIKGFLGFQAAKELDMIKNWVLAVNPSCK